MVKLEDENSAEMSGLGLGGGGGGSLVGGWLFFFLIFLFFSTVMCCGLHATPSNGN